MAKKSKGGAKALVPESGEEAVEGHAVEQQQPATTGGEEDVSPPVVMKRAKKWHDEEDDDDAYRPKSFQTSDKLPAWALKSQEEIEEEGEKGQRKRPRVDDKDDAMSSAVDSLLQSTAPVLHSKHQRREALVPRVCSIVPLKNQSVQAMAWHKSGEVLVVATNRDLHVHHVTGRYSERLASWPAALKKTGGRRGGAHITQLALTHGGDAALVLCSETYVPQLIDLGTGKITQLSCMDPRNGTASFRLFQGRTKAGFPSKLAMAPEGDPAQRCAIINGQSVDLLSVSNATVATSVTLSDNITGCVFSGANELTITARNKVYVYDVRKSARALRSFVDEGSLLTTSVAMSPSMMACGSSSGVVNLYMRGSEKPHKTLMNLPTVVDEISMGSWDDGKVEWMSMTSTAQVNGLRLVAIPSCRVVPSFPDVGMKHQFIHCTAFNPVTPTLSVGEEGRVVNYAIKGTAGVS